MRPIPRLDSFPPMHFNASAPQTMRRLEVTMPVIVNFGSLNIDHVYHVEHFVRPGETLDSHAYEKSAGGRGFNQSVALARAGIPVRHAGKNRKASATPTIGIRSSHLPSRSRPLTPPRQATPSSVTS
jgi:hypothetical protein